MKDWTGNAQSVMATLNSSNNTTKERAEMDYYATPPQAVLELLKKENFSSHILEPACGEGHISKTLESKWKIVLSSDIVDRGFWEVLDFLSPLEFMNNWHGDIITNPPFSKSTEFLESAMDKLIDGWKCAMLLRIQFLEGVKRNKVFKKYPPKKIYVFSRNIRCAKNWDFENATWNASTYAWFVWEKWSTSLPILDWII